MTPFDVTGNERLELNPGLETQILGLETRYSIISNPPHTHTHTSIYIKLDLVNVKMKLNAMQTIACNVFVSISALHATNSEI